jgi:hypothetical protein
MLLAGAFPCFLLSAWAPHSAMAAMRDVDVAIVLAVDVSYSIDRAGAIGQKRGHAAALRSRKVLDAIKSGPRGCIAVTYVEWASSGSIQTVLPWTEICNARQAAAAADGIENMAFEGVGRRVSRRTSLSYAIDVSRLLLDDFPAHASRKVIDISSNGTNNDGVPVTQARTRALDRGYIINGIILATDEAGVTDNLPAYFKANVIGGSGAFVMLPKLPQDYSDAILKKLELEIAINIVAPSPE